jgi:hypothetical protein
LLILRWEQGLAVRWSHAKGNAPSTIRFPTVNNGPGRGLSSETEGQTIDCRAFSWLAGGDKTAGNG